MGFFRKKKQEPKTVSLTMTISREPDKAHYGATYKIFRFKVRGAEQC